MVIYALIDPRDNIIKYVGLTTDGFSRIRDYYSKKLKDKTKKANWVRKLKSLGLCFGVQYLEYCASEGELKLAEIKWIKYYRDLGYALKNTTDGGDSVHRCSYTEEEKRAISERNKVIFGTPEIREKMRQLARGNTHRRGQKYTPEQRARITKANQEESGIKIIDQHGVVYPSQKYLAKLLGCSINTVKDRLNHNPNLPLKGLLLRKVK